MNKDTKMIIENIDVDGDYIARLAYLTLDMEFDERVKNIIFASDIVEKCNEYIGIYFESIITKGFARFAYNDSKINKYEDVFIGSYFEGNKFIVKDPVRFMYLYYRYSKYHKNEEDYNE